MWEEHPAIEVQFGLRLVAALCGEQFVAVVEELPFAQAELFAKECVVGFAEEVAVELFGDLTRCEVGDGDEEGVALLVEQEKFGERLATNGQCESAD